MIIAHDFAYESMFNSIVDWYKKYYIWHDRDHRMGIHLEVFMQEYEQPRFSDYKSIGPERDKFLIEIQDKAEELRALL